MPRFSSFLCFFLISIYLVSFIINVATGMPLWMHWFFCLFLSLNLVYVLYRHVFYRHTLSVKRFWYDETDQWKIQCSDAHVRSAKLMYSIIISRYLILLSFKVKGRFFLVSLPLAFDSDVPENLHLLRQTLTRLRSA